MRFSEIISQKFVQFFHSCLTRMLFVNDDVPRLVFPFFRGGRARVKNADRVSRLEWTRLLSHSSSKTRNVRCDRIAVSIARYLRVSISRREVCVTPGEARESCYSSPRWRKMEWIETFLSRAQWVNTCVRLYTRRKLFVAEGRSSRSPSNRRSRGWDNKFRTDISYFREEIYVSSSQYVTIELDSRPRTWLLANKRD